MPRERHRLQLFTTDHEGRSRSDHEGRSGTDRTPFPLRARRPLPHRPEAASAPGAEAASALAAEAAPAPAGGRFRTGCGKRRPHRGADRYQRYGPYTSMHAAVSDPLSASASRGRSPEPEAGRRG
ncbi:hypothetical protein GCM10010451_44340 [Streptomyces virens]|uniref:Uncharacterized protein n=1 Tax=Streptomyces virens TaxID=285572 RepID=A0ABP6PTC3_9ACTN